MLDAKLGLCEAPDKHVDGLSGIEQLWRQHVEEQEPTSGAGVHGDVTPLEEEHPTNRAVRHLTDGRDPQSGEARAAGGRDEQPTQQRRVAKLCVGDAGKVRKNVDERRAR